MIRCDSVPSTGFQMHVILCSFTSMYTLLVASLCARTKVVVRCLPASLLLQEPTSAAIFLFLLCGAVIATKLSLLPRNDNNYSLPIVVPANTCYHMLYYRMSSQVRTATCVVPSRPCPDLSISAICTCGTASRNDGLPRASGQLPATKHFRKAAPNARVRGALRNHGPPPNLPTHRFVPLAKPRFSRR